jgi:CO/xanthine dehydrogenase FAD-binding subunit
VLATGAAEGLGGASVEDADRLRAAGALAAEAAGAVEDANGSAEYKEQLVRVLVERCLRDVLPS